MMYSVELVNQEEPVIWLAAIVQLEGTAPDCTISAKVTPFGVNAPLETVKPVPRLVTVVVCQLPVKVPLVRDTPEPIAVMGSASDNVPLESVIPEPMAVIGSASESVPLERLKPDPMLEHVPAVHC